MDLPHLGKYHTKEEVGITVREWLGMQQSRSAVTEFLSPSLEETTGAICSGDKPQNDDISA